MATHMTMSLTCPSPTSSPSRIRTGPERFSYNDKYGLLLPAGKSFNPSELSNFAPKPLSSYSFILDIETNSDTQSFFFGSLASLTFEIPKRGHSTFPWADDMNDQGKNFYGRLLLYVVDIESGKQALLYWSVTWQRLDEIEDFFFGRYFHFAATCGELGLYPPVRDSATGNTKTIDSNAFDRRTLFAHTERRCRTSKSGLDVASSFRGMPE